MKISETLNRIVPSKTEQTIEALILKLKKSRHKKQLELKQAATIKSII